MAASSAHEQSAPAGEVDDPFTADLPGSSHIRHGHLDARILSLSPGASAEQAKRALEAHLRETERRMADAGKLGTALLRQQKELSDRLKEVEQLESDGGLDDELRRKLVEIEKDYNEVARESARALLPKQRVPSNEAAPGSPFAPEGQGGRRSASPSKFESLATGSPTKPGVPSRKPRGQLGSRIHDIEFAAEISTSLISQVRNLQAVLAEKDEELRGLKAERARLETEVESFQQRMKSLDESEHRYKDENWNLETQIHELMAAQKEAADREKKLRQNLGLVQAEKNSTQKELDEVKEHLSQQDEKSAAAIKNLEIELGTSRRSAALLESERLTMQRKVEDLTSQNQELARAFSLQRGRASERESGLGMSDEDLVAMDDNGTPEHSPPPSPVKGTPRHSVLESETLKTSLHHAQRTIQGLRSNVHREKTEKLELKRMLQEARDELERTRMDANTSSHRRSRKSDAREPRKLLGPGHLGGVRSSRTELYWEDPDWEDHGEAASITTWSPALQPPEPVGPPVGSASDHFETANETSDAAFETAHERGTETEDFQTGVEDLSDDDNDDAATETEASPSKGAAMAKRPPALPLGQPSSRYSFQSTASTSSGEDGERGLPDLKTPTSYPPVRMRLRVSRGALNRRSRQASEEATLHGSPASFANSSASGTPLQPSQSLFAELGDLDGSDDDSPGGGATPSGRSARSVTPGSAVRWRSTPPPEVPALPKVIMADAGMMTEPRPDAAAAWLRDMHDTLAQFPSPPSSPNNTRLEHGGILSRQIEHVPLALTFSSIQSEQVEPEVHAENPGAPVPELRLSRIVAEHIEPAAVPELVQPDPVSLTLSPVLSEHVEPAVASAIFPLDTPSLHVTDLLCQDVEPVEEPEDPHRAPVASPRSIDVSFASAVQGEAVLATLTCPPLRTEEIFPDQDGVFHTLSPSAVQSQDSHIQAPDAQGAIIPAPHLSDTPKPQSSLSVEVQQTNNRPVPTRDTSVQTTLTSEVIGQIIGSEPRPPNIEDQAQPDDVFNNSANSPGTPSTVRIHRRPYSRESNLDNLGRPKGKTTESYSDGRRPASSASARVFLDDTTPLPPNHRHAIEAAARTGSAGGGGQNSAGTMAPPLFPASALRGRSVPHLRPRTPNGPKPMSPVSAASSRWGTSRPRASGTAEVLSPPRMTHSSRQSSLSSFASEIDTRFNMYPDFGLDPRASAGPTVDSRMIRAITQTMIGEYLWKYTRKPGRGGMSDNRHCRYFWVHPYTRTLYWSDRDPSGSDRAELRAKSVPIEAVRVVADDNPMPPGLHRKSLVVISPGRSVKFTCATGQSHEVWFNALSYLLLRSDDEGQTDAEEIAGNITREDVQEFNPSSFGPRSASRTRPGATAASLSSYNSRAPRNQSPAVAASTNVPTLTSPHKTAPQSQPTVGTLSRISSYWRDSSSKVLSGTFGSLRGRRDANQLQHDMYEASRVHDSAEDLREMMDRQDQESDRLENVRACCDGKHDVGMLTHNARLGGRHAHSGPSTTRAVMGTVGSRS